MILICDTHCKPFPSVRQGSFKLFSNCTWIHSYCLQTFSPLAFIKKPHTLPRTFPSLRILSFFSTSPSNGDEEVQGALASQKSPKPRGALKGSHPSQKELGACSAVLADPCVLMAGFCSWEHRVTRGSAPHSRKVYPSSLMPCCSLEGKESHAKQGEWLKIFHGGNFQTSAGNTTHLYQLQLPAPC